MSAPAEVTLDKDRTVAVPWTITNSLTRDVEVGLTPVPAGVLSPEWLAVVGGPVRRIPAGGTAEAQVVVRAPDEAPPGEGNVRLDAVLDDDARTVVAGPAVLVTIPGRRRWGWIVAVIGAVALIALIAVLAWLLNRDDDEPVEETPPAAPVPSAAPVVVGDPTVGSELSVQAGTWEGGAPVGYRWQRCAGDDLDSCADIPEAVTSSYLVTEEDVESSLRVVETARTADEAGPTAEQVSDPVGPVPAPEETPEPPAEPEPPVAAGPPGIVGDPIVGATLTVAPGAWQGGEPVAYRWQRCETLDPGTCADIPGADGAAYVVTGADQDRGLRLIEVAASPEGAEAEQPSSVIGPVVPPETPVETPDPVNLVPPAVSGSLVVGDVVTVTPGQWDSGAPVAWRWQRCEPGAPDSCVDVTGLGGTSYLVGVDDVGQALRVIEIAADSPPAIQPDGSITLPQRAAVATSALTGEIAPPPTPTGTVPDVVGQAATDAVRSLYQAGFGVTFVTSEETVDECDPPVEAQDPAAGSEADIGTAVTLTVPDPTVPCPIDVVQAAGLLLGQD
jgi:hypothetical protein